MKQLLWQHFFSSFRCDLCDKSFKSRQKMSLHRKHVHTGDSQVQCDICGVYVKTQMYLRKHRNLVHCKERKFECNICHARFPLGSTLRLHIKVSDLINGHAGYSGHEDFIQMLRLSWTTVGI